MKYILATLLFLDPTFASAGEAPECKPMKPILADKALRVTALAPGQLNWMNGAYTMLPPMGQAPPKHDGAVLVEDSHQTPTSYSVLWTIGTPPKLACMRLEVPKALVDLLRGVKTSKGEDEL